MRHGKPGEIFKHEKYGTVIFVLDVYSNPEKGLGMRLESPVHLFKHSIAIYIIDNNFGDEWVSL